jgi:hypothetical protein
MLPGGAGFDAVTKQWFGQKLKKAFILVCFWNLVVLNIWVIIVRAC